jgi:hypothetical protein|tara:strand:+ start:8448 stop:9590 length:1143 start_codon:yes stop_codon:yes gene_type:complete
MKKFSQLFESKDFKQHIMYDPKSGKGYKAEKEEDHLRMKKMGYTHEKPSVSEETPLDRKQDRIDKTADLRKARLRHKDEIKKIREELDELAQMRPGSRMVTRKTQNRMKQLQKDLDAMRNSAFGQSADKGDEDYGNEVKNANRKDLRFRRDKFDGVPKSYGSYKDNRKPVMAAKESVESDNSENLTEDMPPMAEIVMLATAAKVSTDIMIGMLKSAYQTGKGLNALVKLGNDLGVKIGKKISKNFKESVESEESDNSDNLDEVLNMQQRLARSRMFKRHAKRNARKREKKLRRKATQGDLLKRAEKAAKKVLIKKFTKGADKQDQSTARKIEIEKRIAKMQPRIKAMAKKMLPVVRQREKERFGKVGKTSPDAGAEKRDS